MAVNTRLEQFINGVAVQVYNEQSCLLMEQRMRKAYQAAITDIQKKLDDFYEKYAKDNKISLQEAKLKLNAKDTQSVQNIAEEYRKLLNRKRIGRGTQQKLKEIVSKAKATRYDELLVNCVEQLAKVGVEANDEMDDTASLMYKDAFGHTMFNTQKTLGMGVNFNLPSERLIRVASNIEWLGSTFKERTGYTLDAVTNNIETIMTEAFIQGKNPDKLGKLLARQFNMSENACKRDMRTLTTMITNQASVMAYKNCELVEEYEFVATLDGKTSDKCRAMDGKRFKIIEAVAFVNLPPLHYNCRSTTIPYFDDLDEFSASDRIARDESGKSYFVGEDVTYKDWVTSHARGLYARNDKTDWNYTPEKVIANEVIIEERQKLKKLQEERVVYDAAELTSGNIDLSVYSDKQLDKVKTYLKSIGMIDDSVSSFKDNNVFKDAVIKFSDKILALRKKLQESDLNGNNGLNFTKDELDFLLKSVDNGAAFLISTIDPNALNAASVYQRFVTTMGLNEKPTTVNHDEFDEMLKDSEYPEVFRAVANAGDTGEAFDVKGRREQRGKYIRRAIMNDLLYGEKQFIGNGIYGDGLYFSTKPTHDSYGGVKGTKDEAIERKFMVRAAIKPGTKVIAYHDIPALKKKLGLEGIPNIDLSTVARLAGYKVIKAGMASGLGSASANAEEYYNIIDRSCLVVEDVDKAIVVDEQKRKAKHIARSDIDNMFFYNPQRAFPIIAQREWENNFYENNKMKLVHGLNSAYFDSDMLKDIFTIQAIYDGDNLEKLNAIGVRINTAALKKKAEQLLKKMKNVDNVKIIVNGKTYDVNVSFAKKHLTNVEPMYADKDDAKKYSELFIEYVNNVTFDIEDAIKNDVFKTDYTKQDFDEMQKKPAQNLVDFINSIQQEQKDSEIEAKGLTSKDIQQIERKDNIDWDEMKKQAQEIFKYYKQTEEAVKKQEEKQLEKEVVSKNNQKYYKQVMHDIFERNDFAMSMNGSTLALIAKSWFMNQLESGRAPLGLTRNKRMKLSKGMFGIPNDADFGDFEKYGYLASKNPKDDFKYNEQFTGCYGNTVVRFKKKNLLPRTTFTVGDSLYNFEQGWVTASPVVDPSIASIKQGDVNKTIYGMNVCENADQLKNTISIQGASRQKYIELQYHGKVTIDDVESVTINANSQNPDDYIDIYSEEMQEIIEMLKAKGIKVYYVDSVLEEIQQL